MPARARPWSRDALGRRPTVGGAVARFALTGLVVLLVVGVGGVEILRRAGRTEAIRDAREVTRLVALGVVGAAVTPALLDGDPRARARMDRVVRTQVLRGPIVRVKLWTADGRVVYSDEHRLIGSRYPLSRDDLSALRTGRAEAEVSDLSRPENRFERGQGKVLEVYLGVAGPGGRRLLFETYQRYSAVSTSARDRWVTFLPVLVGALVVLALLQLPLAVSLARRMRRAEQDRIAALERAADAQAVERRRIAGDLHDGVVQTLAGISFRLAAASEHLNGRTPPQVAEGVRIAARETRESMRALRSLLVEIYPPSLQREGLTAALSDLLTRTAGPELDTELDAPEDLQLPPEVEALVFRAAQEALRNVVAHAQAMNVRVAVGARDGRVRLEVTDDGHGFDASELDRPRQDAHFGLRALADLVAEHGGALDVRSTPGTGTTLTAEVPFA